MFNTFKNIGKYTQDLVKDVKYKLIIMRLLFKMKTLKIQKVQKLIKINKKNRNNHKTVGTMGHKRGF